MNKLHNPNIGYGLVPFLLAANEREGFLASPGRDLDLFQPGVAYAANESDFASASYDRPMTDYLVGGWDQDQISEALDFIAPAIETSREVTYKEYDHKDEFLADDADEDIRPIGADFRQIQHSVRGNVKITVPNKGFKVVLDRDKIQLDPSLPRRELRRTMRRLKRNELRRAIALLDAAATTVNLVFASNTDPDALVSGQLQLAEDTSGLRPNRVVYGATAWHRRDLSHRAQDNAGSNASVSWTPDRLAMYLQVAMLMVGEVRVREAFDTLAAYLGNSIYMYNASAGISEEDPSNIKRFRSNASNGMGMAVHIDDSHAKLVAYSVEHYSHLALTSALGIRKANANLS